jgi:D-aspartate ligase
MFPIILKPGDGIVYHDYEFPEQAKVYKLESFAEVVDTIRLIQNSGYNNSLILQEFIPGDDSMLFDSILYCDSQARPQLMSFAQIGLQEHTPGGIGNCTVLVNGYNQFGNTHEIQEKLVRFLEQIEYRGIAEFDLKYDTRDQTFKVFEINPRQARSSYYLTACGYNLAQYLVDDLIYHTPKDFVFIDKKMALSFVPLSVIKEHVTNEALKAEVLALKKAGKYVRPLHYAGDKSLKRTSYLAARDRNYKKKYKEHSW